MQASGLSMNFSLLTNNKILDKASKRFILPFFFHLLKSIIHDSSFTDSLFTSTFKIREILEIRTFNVTKYIFLLFSFEFLGVGEAEVLTRNSYY